MNKTNQLISFLIILFLSQVTLKGQDFFDTNKKDLKIQLSTQWEKDFAVKGEIVKLALIVDLSKSNHFNAPTKLQLKEAIKLGVIPIEVNIKKTTDGIIAQEAIFPKPHQIKVKIDPNKPAFKVNTYEGRVVIYIPFKFSNKIKLKNVNVDIEFKYQICNDKNDCFLPASKKISAKINYKRNTTTTAPANVLFLDLQKTELKNLEQPLFGELNPKQKIDKIKITTRWEKDYATKDELVHLAVILELEDKHHINPPTKLMVPSDDQFLIPTEFKITKLTKGIVAQSPIYPKPHSVEVTYDPKKPNEKINVYEGKVIIYVPFTFSSGITSEKIELKFELGYQVCNERNCFRPETKKIVVSLDYKPNETKKGSITEDYFKRIPEDSLNSATLNLAEETIKPLTSGGIILLMLMAVLGGLILNFTPCVLPVIPLKIMSLTNHSDSKKKSMILGFSMVAGIVLFWILIGVMIIGLTSVNSISELFQYGEFRIGIGIFIAIMAVGMCGLFTINVPQSVARFNPSFDSVAGSFGIGVMTAILSTPCTAPFMGTAIAGAMTQSPFIIIIIFSLVGLGMSFPYGLLSVFPKLVSWLPKSGPSSVAIKQTMGIFMLAAACFFIGNGLISLGLPANKREYFWWPTMIVCAFGGLAIILFTLKIKPSMMKRFIFIILGASILNFSLYLGYDLSKKDPLLWLDYTPSILEQVKKESNPVIINFTAVWCLNCKALKKTILQSEEVLKAIKDNNVTLVKVDITDKEKEKIDFLNKSGSLTIPYLLILDKKGKIIFKSNYYSKQDIIEHIKK